MFGRVEWNRKVDIPATPAPIRCECLLIEGYGLGKAERGFTKMSWRGHGDSTVVGGQTILNWPINK
jgi:hypothetical protein